MSRVVVVGAGVGGLAAAARLAAHGHEVTVFEQAATVGGKLGEFHRNGFTFDTGPSLLTMPAVFDELFAATGGPADLDVVPVDPACRYRFADGTELDVPHDPAAVPAALDAALGPGAGAAWAALHERSSRVWELVGRDVLARPRPTAVDLLRLSARIDRLALIAPWRTLRGLGRSTSPDARLRMWLDRYATYSGSDPRATPAVLAVTAYVEQAFGAWWVRGGMRRLAEALLARCRALGVTVHTGAEVTAIRTGPWGVSGVELAAGERVAADVVVSDADAAVLYGRLLDAPPTRTLRGVHRALHHAPRSLAGFVLLLALDGNGDGGGEGGRSSNDSGGSENGGSGSSGDGSSGDDDGSGDGGSSDGIACRNGDTGREAAHRIWFPADYDAEFDAVLGRRPRPVADPTVYVHAPSDPALVPDDRSEGWFLLVNAPPHDPAGGVDWTAPGRADRYADHLLDVLAARGTDVRGRLRWREVRTPADLESATASPGGSIYGTASHGAAAALARPANRSPIPGLYLVGGSTHPGGGLPLVVLSAAVVAELIGPA